MLDLLLGKLGFGIHRFVNTALSAWDNVFLKCSHLNQRGSAALGVREGKSGEKLLQDIFTLMQNHFSNSTQFLILTLKMLLDSKFRQNRLYQTVPCKVMIPQVRHVLCLEGTHISSHCVIPSFGKMEDTQKEKVQSVLRHLIVRFVRKIYSKHHAG